jgi:hypothetical protein
MKSKYKLDLAALEENQGILSGEIYVFEAKGRKASGINARAALLNIKKIVTKLRKMLNEDIKNLPKHKRNITPEALQAAKEKRQKTIEAKKNG